MSPGLPSDATSQQAYDPTIMAYTIGGIGSVVERRPLAG